MLRTTSLLVFLVALAACGGGGGGGLGQGPGGGNPSGWQQGVFDDFLTFYAQCQAPRAGNNPITGNPWPDVAGSTLDENNFLRSYTNDTYLWYDEVTDQDPGLFNDPLAYFDELKTFATSPTATGVCSRNDPTNEAEHCKDKFHFTWDTDDFNQLSQSGVSAGYGVQWAFISNVPPRELLIAYTEPNSPATNIVPELERGASILAIDGVDVRNGSDVDTLNAGLFPELGQTYTFTVLDLGSATPRDVVLTAENITSAPVQDVKEILTPTGSVGYMAFHDHISTAEQALIDAVNEMNTYDNGQGISDLVLDIRYNGGGWLDIAGELAYMIAGPVPTAGQTFDELTFNDKHPVTDPVTGQALAPTPFHTTALGAPFNGTPGQALPTLDLPRVFVLTGPNTCSASEAIMNGLRGVGVEVIQVGSTTCGKPYGFYPTDNCGTTYFTIQFRGANAMGFGDYSDGFSPANSSGPGEDVPGCSIADDFTKQLGDQTEGRFATALAYRDGAACPAASGFAPGVLSKPGGQLSAVEVVIPKSPLQTNRLMRPWQGQ